MRTIVKQFADNMNEALTNLSSKTIETRQSVNGIAYVRSVYDDLEEAIENGQPANEIYSLAVRLATYAMLTANGYYLSKGIAVQDPHEELGAPDHQDSLDALVYALMFANDGGIFATPKLTQDLINAFLKDEPAPAPSGLIDKTKDAYQHTKHLLMEDVHEMIQAAVESGWSGVAYRFPEDMLKADRATIYYTLKDEGFEVTSHSMDLSGMDIKWQFTKKVDK